MPRPPPVVDVATQAETFWRIHHPSGADLALRLLLPFIGWRPELRPPVPDLRRIAREAAWWLLVHGEQGIESRGLHPDITFRDFFKPPRTHVIHRQRDTVHGIHLIHRVGGLQTYMFPGRTRRAWNHISGYRAVGNDAWFHLFGPNGPTDLPREKLKSGGMESVRTGIRDMPGSPFGFRTWGTGHYPFNRDERSEFYRTLTIAVRLATLGDRRALRFEPLLSMWRLGNFPVGISDPDRFMIVRVKDGT